jgi:predicted O-methyltransferase YrrM
MLPPARREASREALREDGVERLAEGSLENAPVKIQGAASQSGMLLRAVPDFEKIDGWLKAEDAELLFAAAASVRTGCIVELGSYRGRSTVALCAGSVAGGKVPVYAIDPHEHFVGIKGGVFGPGDRRAFFKTMLTTRYANIVRLINTTSQVIAPGWDKPVSMLFVDGDHRYEAVLSDIAAWKPHLADNALVIFNDATGAGTALVIKDMVREGTLTPVQTVGRLAMLCFNAVDGAVDPETIAHSGVAPVYPEMAAPLPGAQASLVMSQSTYYSARGNYLYRAIPKCACSTVKTALIELEGLELDLNPTKRHDKSLNKFPGTETLTPAQEKELFAGNTDTFKFVIVRDPYSRLASAYADKILEGYTRRGDFWIDKIKKTAGKHKVKLSDKITFEEFVRVVSLQSEAEMDVHWRQQYTVARFDLIKFDFVGRTELISTDFAYILERIKAPAAIMHKAIQPHNVTGSSLTMWSSVSGEVRREFLKTFAIDFDTLRYPMRHSSVLFSPVNVDRPKPAPFPVAEHKADK